MCPECLPWWAIPAPRMRRARRRSPLEPLYAISWDLCPDGACKGRNRTAHVRSGRAAHVQLGKRLFGPESLACCADMAEIGATLREARMRARIDVSEIEAQTKIRAKYLRALENEEWDLLPGPTFIKSFLRTYAQALGLDAKALVEEYRLNYERPSEAALEPIVSTPRSSPARARVA